MEIRIPLVRSHFLVVLVAAVTALIRGKTTLRFSTQEVNGKKRPVILSRDEVARLSRTTSRPRRRCSCYATWLRR
jgi:hypothetical protein